MKRFTIYCLEPDGSYRATGYKHCTFAFARQGLRDLLARYKRMTRHGSKLKNNTRVRRDSIQINLRGKNIVYVAIPVSI